MPDFVKLPSERVEQLRILSKARDMSIADLIAEFVRNEIANGRLTHELPGFGVQRIGAEIEVDLGVDKRTFPLEMAHAYATALRWFAAPKAAGHLQTFRDITQNLSGAHLVGIGRKGTSIKLTGDAGGERTIAPSIARDLADWIDSTASS